MKSISDVKKALGEESIISEGYGEYITYRDNNGVLEAIDQKTYEACYDMFCQLRSKGGSIGEAGLQSIDPYLKTTFVPRTLYELFYIEASVKEDLKRGSSCKNIELHKLQKNLSGIDLENEEGSNDEYCWHAGYFEDFGNDKDSKIQKSSFELNNLIFKELNLKKPGDLTFKKINEVANVKLLFMASCHKQSNSEIFKTLSRFVKRVDGGITSCIMSEMNGGYIRPVGIKNDNMKSLVCNAIALECSEFAKNSIILYRGSKFEEDSTIDLATGGAYSLSYGTGLFAGTMYDPEASAFHYMRGSFGLEENIPFALHIPYSEKEQSPFTIPTTHPLCQILGRGEFFHARTKAWTKEINEGACIGCSSESMGRVKDLPESFKLDVTREGLATLFKKYMEQNTVALHL